MRTSTKIAMTVVGGLLAAAVAQEMRKPASQRTWRGKVAGVPYDLRVPTPARIAEGLWAPEDPRILIERGPFGLGWGINLARFVHPRHEVPRGGF